jgi:hypothetical protein
MHRDPVEIALLLIGGIGPILLLVRSLVGRKCVYAAWAKLAYPLTSVAGLTWLIIERKELGSNLKGVLPKSLFFEER